MRKPSFHREPLPPKRNLLERVVVGLDGFLKVVVRGERVLPSFWKVFQKLLE